MYKLCAVKAKDKELTEQKKKCKETFGKCKKLEDKSSEYVYKCKTSMKELAKTLTSLKYAKTMLGSVNTNIASLLNSSTKAKRYKRQGSASFLQTIQSLIAVLESSSVISLGTNSLFTTSATTIIQTDMTTIILTITQITEIQTFIVRIAGVIQTIVTRITVITIIMIDMGKCQL